MVFLFNSSARAPGARHAVNAAAQQTAFTKRMSLPPSAFSFALTESARSVPAVDVTVEWREARQFPTRPGQFRRAVTRGWSWSLVVGCWSIVDGRWSLVDGRWSLVDGRWSLVDGRLSVVVGRWSFVVGGLFLVCCDCMFIV